MEGAVDIIARDGNRTLAFDGEDYVMAGGWYGEHRLSVASTTDARLKAHWLGYCQADSGHTLADVVTKAKATATEAELTRSYFDSSDARTKRMIVECDHEAAQDEGAPACLG
jgi:hypothetical protein